MPLMIVVEYLIIDICGGGGRRAAGMPLLIVGEELIIDVFLINKLL